MAWTGRLFPTFSTPLTLIVRKHASYLLYLPIHASLHNFQRVRASLTLRRVLGNGS